MYLDKEESGCPSPGPPKGLCRSAVCPSAVRHCHPGPPTPPPTFPPRWPLPSAQQPKGAPHPVRSRAGAWWPLEGTYRFVLAPDLWYVACGPRACVHVMIRGNQTDQTPVGNSNSRCGWERLLGASLCSQMTSPLRHVGIRRHWHEIRPIPVCSCHTTACVQLQNMHPVLECHFQHRTKGPLL